jgi:hypothetical protein
MANVNLAGSIVDGRGQAVRTKAEELGITASDYNTPCANRCANTHTTQPAFGGFSGKFRFDYGASWPAKVRNVSEAGGAETRALVTPPPSFVRLCYDVIVRTTLDISDEAYYIAKAIARDQNRSLGRVVGDLILQSSKGAKGASIKMSDYGFPTFRCGRPVTTGDVKALDDEE